VKGKTKNLIDEIDYNRISSDVPFNLIFEYDVTSAPTLGSSGLIQRTAYAFASSDPKPRLPSSITTLTMPGAPNQLLCSRIVSKDVL